MAVILKTLGLTFDITNYIDTPIEINENLIGLYDTAKIIIPSIKHNEFLHLDLSKKIPLLSTIEIDTIKGVKSFYIEKSTPEKINDLYYKHELLLVEPKFILEDRPIPDIAITQPQTDALSYVSETSRINESILATSPEGLLNMFPMVISQVSNNTDIINNLEVFEDGRYTFNFSATFGRIISPMPGGQIYKLELRAFVNGILKYSYNFGSFGSFFWAMVGTQADKFGLDLLENDKITIGMFASGGIEENPVTVNIKSGYLTIDKTTVLEGQEPIYMDYVVEKLLSLVNVTDNPEFELDLTSKSRLSTILAYDDMLTEMTLKTALERVASFVKARLYVDLEDAKKIVRFAFYDDLSRQDYIEPNDDIDIINAQSNDYFSGLALQNNNVIRENYLIEELLIRANSNTGIQITTENIAIFTKFDIDRIKKIIVSGFDINSYTQADITDLVIEKAYYDTLDNMANYDNRYINNKNNHLFFIRGNNVINGMSFVGVQFDSFNPNAMNRAIYEAIATAIKRANPSETIDKFVDKKLEGDMELRFYIEYYPMATTNAFVYKDDQTGFEQKRIRRLNANDKVNHIDYLGEYARTKVNSLGGTLKSKRGIATYEDIITPLGAVNEFNERVVNITYFDDLFDNVDYYLTLVKDYVFQSHYIGIDSDRRLLHIPRDEFVKRIDKSLNVIYLDIEANYYNNSVIKPELFLKSLGQSGSAILSPKSALVSFDNKDLTTYTDSSATGNTIEIYLEAEDNYSFGMQRKKVANQEVFYQIGTEYANIFGNARNVNIRIKEAINLDNTYPLGNHTAGEEYADFSYIINKDAREQFALSIQTAILSANSSIYVYNGIGKFNRLANNKNYRIDLAVLKYRPNLDDKYIDLGSIIPQTNNVVIADGVITVNLSNSGLGFAFYERDTKELLLAYIGEVDSGYNYIYYKAEQYNFTTEDYMDISGYVFNIFDTQNVNISAYIEEMVEIYAFDILDSQEIILTDISYIASTYEFDIVDTQEVDLSSFDFFDPQILVAREPNEVASLANYLEIETGADGVSEWECRRNTTNHYKWTALNITTTNTNYEVVVENNVCYNEGAFGRDGTPVFGEYEMYRCSFDYSSYTYYWHRLS